MIRARPEELIDEVVSVLEAHLPMAAIRRLIPLELSELDPLAAPEPSLGALLRLRNGLLAVAIYGRETGTLTLRLPKVSVSTESLNILLHEIPIPKEAIRWVSPAMVRSQVAAAAR